MDLVPIKDRVISLDPLKASLLVSYVRKLYPPSSVCHPLTQPRPHEGSGEAPMTDGQPIIKITVLKLLIL